MNIMNVNPRVFYFSIREFQFHGWVCRSST